MSKRVPDLSLLLPLTRLRALDLKLGGTNNLALLPRVGALQYLELWMVRGLHDLSPIADLVTLEYLFLQALKPVTALPSLVSCTRLARVHLETMKGLTDLRPLLTAPALTQLALVDMTHLQPADVAVLSRHPTLGQLDAGLGSRRKNDEVRRLLPLPPLTDHDRHPAPRPAITRHEQSCQGQSIAGTGSVTPGSLNAGMRDLTVVRVAVLPEITGRSRQRRPSEARATEKATRSAAREDT